MKEPLSDDELDRLFQERFSKHKIEPSNKTWERLDSYVADKLEKKKRRAAWFNGLSLASLLILFSVGIYEWNIKEDDAISKKNSLQRMQQKKIEGGITEEEENIIPSEKKAVRSSVVVLEEAIDKQKKPQQQKESSHNNSFIKDSSLSIQNKNISQKQKIEKQKVENINHSDKKTSVALTLMEQVKNDSSFLNKKITEIVSESQIKRNAEIISIKDSMGLALLDSVSIVENTSPKDTTDKNKSILPQVQNTSKSKEMIPTGTIFLNTNFYAGLNIYSTSNASLRNQENVSPIVGLEFTYPIAKSFIAGLAGLYSSQGGYHLHDTATTETYFLDKNVSQQTIEIHRLHKLYFPFTLYYTIAERHSIIGAIQLSYLVNTSSNYTEINKTSGYVTETKKNNVSGYMDGINSTNISYSLGYKYSISKRLGLSTRITRELTDDYNKDHFKEIYPKSSFSFQTFLIIKI